MTADKQLRIEIATADQAKLAAATEEAPLANVPRTRPYIR